MLKLPVVEGQLIVSVSQVKTWLMCPRKYELRYIRGEPPAFIPVALAFGTAFHSALGRFYSGVKAQDTPPLDLVIQTFRDSWQVQLEGRVPLQLDDDEDLAGIVDLAARMLAAFY